MNKEFFKSKKKTYFILKTEEARRRFTADAEKAGITFVDGSPLSEKTVSDVMALENGKLCFVGFVGRVCIRCGGPGVNLVELRRDEKGDFEYSLLNGKTVTENQTIDCSV